MPAQLGIAKTHEWARREGNLAVVGITPYAIEQLGDVVFVELPEIGATFAAGEQFGEIESVKAASELFAPVGGRVVAVNAALEDDYDAIAREPFGAGWMIKLEIAADSDFDRLLTRDQYDKSVAADH